MNWSDVRKDYPDQWLVIEAIEAHTTEDGFRVPDRLAVIESCPDGATAMQRYRQIHQEFPQREFYFIHTSREDLVMRERQWLGVRNGILGMDFLTRTGAVINLRDLQIEFAN